MGAGTERLARVDKQIALWRRRTLLLLAAMALILVGGVWWLARGAAVGPYAPPLVHGGIQGSAHCGTKVAIKEVEDTFGGGGRILEYVDGARCEAVISLKNPTASPVTVLSVEKTPKDMVEPIRLIGATRDPQPLSAEQECHGCSDNFERFSPMTIAPGDEWEIAVQGVMSNCRPAKSDNAFTVQSRETLEFQVDAGGGQRPVSIELENPWAVRHGGCGSRF